MDYPAFNSKGSDACVSESMALADRIAAKLAQRRSIPVGHIELLVTQECNHRCDYCFVKEKSGAHVMREEVGRRAIDFALKQAPRSPQCGVVFFGGEPLLEFSLVRELVGYGRARADQLNVAGKLSFSITTNGSLLTEEMAKFFHDQGIVYLLSVDGDRVVHDAHRKTLDGRSSYDLLMSRFGMMKHYQPWQGARVTVHPDHAPLVHDSVKHLFSVGINQFLIGPASGVEWQEQELYAYRDSLFAALKWTHEKAREGAPIRMAVLEKELDLPRGRNKGKWGCGAGRGRMCVDADGSLYPCSKMHGVGPARETWRLGDVWHGITNYRRRALLLSHDDTIRPECRTCEMKDDCLGGCPANGLEATGNPFLPSPLDCAMNRGLSGLRQDLAEYVRRHPPRARGRVMTGGLKHVRPLG